MEPLGGYLKEVRERKKLEIDKVIEDTYIMKKFIVAIEEDDFTVFPGEAYIKGFLRNYGEYLGLDTQDLIRRYEKIKLSEMPSPMEQLIPKPRASLSKIIFSILLVLIILFLFMIGYFVYSIIERDSGGLGNSQVVKKQKKNNEMLIKEKKEKKKRKGETAEEKIKIYSFESEEGHFTLKKEEKIRFMIDEKEYTIWITDLDPTVILKSSADRQLFLIANGFTNKFDVDGNGKEDLEIVLSYWSEKSATLSIKRVVNSLLNDSSIPSHFFLSDTVETIRETSEKSQISLSISVTETTYVKYKLDDGPEIEGRYFTGARIEIQVNDQMVIWLANAGAVAFRFAGDEKQVIPGESGKIDAKIIAWTKNGNSYSLQMSSLN